MKSIFLFFLLQIICVDGFCQSKSAEHMYIVPDSTKAVFATVGVFLFIRKPTSTPAHAAVWFSTNSVKHKQRQMIYTSIR